MIVYTEFSTVASDLGIPLKTLFAVSNNLASHYKRVIIPKKNGEARELNVPDKILKNIQRAIAEKILSYEPVSPYATAYRFGASVVKNARPHVGNEKLLKLDIKHFFDSILYSAVKERCFPAERFSEKVRILLSMLCYYRESLPQGAPSSPIITNIIMREFDIKIGSFCSERGIKYTRYCDDMTFSGSFDEKTVIEFVKAELFKYGFLLNFKKTAVITCGKQMKVTGVVVNEKLNASADYRRSIRKEVYYCNKFGVESHLSRIGSDESPESYLRSLSGRINFVLQITPNNGEFKLYKNDVKELLKKYSN